MSNYREQEDQDAFYQRQQREQEEAYWKGEEQWHYDRQYLAQLENEQGELDYEQTLIGEDGYSGGWTQDNIKARLAEIEAAIQDIKARNPND